jgi:hypothetical protein
MGRFTRDSQHTQHGGEESHSSPPCVAISLEGS